MGIILINILFAFKVSVILQVTCCHINRKFGKLIQQIQRTLMRNRDLIVLLCFAITIVTAQEGPSSESSDHDRYREMVHESNLERIAFYQQAYSQYYQAGPTKFTHLTQEEFQAHHLGGLLRDSPPSVNTSSTVNSVNGGQASGQAQPGIFDASSSEDLLSTAVPSNFYVSWAGVNATYVSGVKNQGSCGSCWAYAGLAEVESYFLKRHKLFVDLSEQQMVNCVPLMQPGNLGCGGGYIHSVAQYMLSNAVTSERNFPYVGYNSYCNPALTSQGKYKISSYNIITGCDSISNLLISNKPMSICMNIDRQWDTYISGVIPNCDAPKIGGHCVLLVGAKSDGTTNVNTNYWIIKNSWGVNFGEQGYMRLYRNPNDMYYGFCGFCAQGALYTTQ